MSNFAQKDIDRQITTGTIKPIRKTEGYALFSFIQNATDEFLGKPRKPTEQDIARFNENSENRKRELYHQGEDEAGELITKLFQYGEEDEDE